jgi:hypothetical protein
LKNEIWEIAKQNCIIFDGLLPPLLEFRDNDNFMGQSYDELDRIRYDGRNGNLIKY